MTDLMARLMEGQEGRELTEQEVADTQLEQSLEDSGFFDSEGYVAGQVASAIADRFGREM